jgi:N6-adenosine-specific RNA methylase IME4
VSVPFSNLQRGHYKAILADPPWPFRTYSRDDAVPARGEQPYRAMTMDDIAALPVADLAADECVLFMWTCWPVLKDSFRVLEAWGFTYKTCGFSWMKADPYRLFADDKTPFAGMGYWTRANTEPCLLATRGKPKRINADVRQGIIAPRREHSRKPDEIHDRIQRLVAGPYLELFGRQSRPGWDVWGNESTKFDEVAA